VLNNKGAILGIALVIIGIVMIISSSGCVSDNASNTSTQQYQTHILLCPNTDCVLNKPDGHANGYAGYVRPISVYYSPQDRHTHYICGLCGEQWTD